MWHRLAPRPDPGALDLAAESVALSIRWFGLVVGVLLANFGQSPYPLRLNGLLALGLGFTALNTFFYSRGRVFLRDYPLAVSALEAVFIALLCRFDAGLDSPFRFYYLLSLICCAMRHTPRVTFATCGLDGLSYSALFLFTADADRNVSLYLLTLVILAWVTWAAGAMARMLQRAGDDLRRLNAEMVANQQELERRIADRTRQLEESQAQVQHQEKMAAFGLLAAGIAHEVGNPLTGISGIVQMLERRDPDAYTREKLSTVTHQLARIQTILRELVTFSRPADDTVGRVRVREVIDEALGIAKYYKGGKNRDLTVSVPDDLPVLAGVRDQLVQVVFNLVLNAIDATGKGGRIALSASKDTVANRVVLTVTDDGGGIDAATLARLFRPYVTTKRHGTGLGLFVVRRIVESHGGQVAVDSAPGHGATFRVELPVPSG
jgi:two-component system, NtrC family, sensor kinase